MRPVADEFGVTQAFGSYATAGVTPDPNGTEVQQLVAAYGNYQPYGHAGQDIGTPIGTPVHAIAAGTVLWSDWGTNLPGDETDAGYRQRWYLYKTFPGIVVVIQHDGWIGVYAHLSETPLNPGDTVTEGQQIALSGNTRAPGVTLGAHLHVEALIDNSYPSGNGLIYGRTDPTPYFGGGSINFQSATPQEDSVTPEQMQELKLFVQTCVNDSISKMWATEGVTQQLIKDTVSSLSGHLTISPNQAEDIVQAVVNRAPNAFLNAKLPLTSGQSASVAWVLDALNNKPAATGTVTSAPADPAAIVDAIVSGVNIQIVKK